MWLIQGTEPDLAAFIVRPKAAHTLALGEIFTFAVLSPVELQFPDDSLCHCMNDLVVRNVSDDPDLVGDDAGGMKIALEGGKHGKLCGNFFARKTWRKFNGTVHDLHASIVPFSFKWDPNNLKMRLNSKSSFSPALFGDAQSEPKDAR